MPGGGAINLLAATETSVRALELEVANIGLIVVGGWLLVGKLVRGSASGAKVANLWSPPREFREGLEWLLVPFVVLVLASSLMSGIVGPWLGAPSAPGVPGAGEAGPPTAYQTELTQVVATNLAMVFGAVAGWWVGRRQVATARRPFLRGSGKVWRETRRGVVAALVAIALCQGVLFVTVSLIHWVFPKYAFAEHSVIDVLRNPACPWWAPGVLWLGVVIATPLAEEFFFRGLLQTALGGLVKRRGLAIALAGLLFGLAHASQPQVIPAIAIFGIILGIAYERSGSLVAPIVAHALFNAKTLLWEALLHG